MSSSSGSDGAVQVDPSDAEYQRLLAEYQPKPSAVELARRQLVCELQWSRAGQVSADASALADMQDQYTAAWQAADNTLAETVDGYSEAAQLRWSTTYASETQDREEGLKAIAGSPMALDKSEDTQRAEISSLSSELNNNQAQLREAILRVCEGHDVRQIALGAVHSLVLLENGELFAVGLKQTWLLGGEPNDTGKEGDHTVGVHRVRLPRSQQGQSSSSSLSDSEDASEGEGGRVIQVAVGLYHSVVVTQEGNVYAWGINKHGQLGMGGCSESVDSPTLMASVEAGVCVTRVAAGLLTTYLLTSQGDVLACGAASRGQLGVCSKEETASRYGNAGGCSGEATKVQLPSNTRVLDLACGAHHCVALCAHMDEQGTDMLHVYSWGHGAFGQLGHGDSRDAFVPTRVELLSDKDVDRVACGHNHSMALTITGDVYAWGNNGCGQLGLGQELMGTPRVTMPTLVKSLVALNVRHITCGAQHTMLLADVVNPANPPLLLGFGRNSESQLLVDSQRNEADVTLIKRPFGDESDVSSRHIEQVFTGGNLTVALERCRRPTAAGQAIHTALAEYRLFNKMMSMLVRSLLNPMLVAESQGQPVIAPDLLAHLTGNCHRIFAQSRLAYLTMSRLQRLDHVITFVADYVRVALPLFDAYIRNYADTVAACALNKCLQSDAFLSFLDACRQKPGCENMEPRSLFQVTLDRFNQLTLLVQALIDCTRGDNKDDSSNNNSSSSSGKQGQQQTDGAGQDEEQRRRVIIPGPVHAQLQRLADRIVDVSAPMNSMLRDAKRTRKFWLTNPKLSDMITPTRRLVISGAADEEVESAPNARYRDEDVYGHPFQNRAYLNSQSDFLESMASLLFSSKSNKRIYHLVVMNDVLLVVKSVKTVDAAGSIASSSADSSSSSVSSSLSGSNGDRSTTLVLHTELPLATVWVWPHNEVGIEHGLMLQSPEYMLVVDCGSAEGQKRWYRIISQAVASALGLGEVSDEAWAATEESNGGLSMLSERQASHVYSNHVLYAEATYKGEWRDGLMQGVGEMRFADGVVYQGDWQEHKQSGYGTASNTSTHETYKGEWVNGKPHGWGTHLNANGDSYAGGWSNGCRSGWGVALFSKGARYVGWWKLDDRHGWGVFKQFASSEDMRERTGCVFLYMGYWVRHARAGRGLFLDRHGNVYDGHWEGDLKHGLGMQTYADGSHFRCEFAKGQHAGRGICSFSNGMTMQGIFHGSYEDGLTITSAQLLPHGVAKGKQAHKVNSWLKSVGFLRRGMSQDGTGTDGTGSSSSSSSSRGGHTGPSPLPASMRPMDAKDQLRALQAVAASRSSDQSGSSKAAMAGAEAGIGAGKWDEEEAAMQSEGDAGDDNNNNNNNRGGNDDNTDDAKQQQQQQKDTGAGAGDAGASSASSSGADNAQEQQQQAVEYVSRSERELFDMGILDQNDFVMEREPEGQPIYNSASLRRQLREHTKWDEVFGKGDIHTPLGDERPVEEGAEGESGASEAAAAAAEAAGDTTDTSQEQEGAEGKADAKEEAALRQQLIGTLQSKSHHLGSFVFQFVQVFMCCYEWVTPDNCKFLMSRAVEDVHSFVGFLLRNVREMSERELLVVREEELVTRVFYSVMETVLFPQVSPQLFAMYRIANEPVDKRYRAQLARKRNMNPVQLLTQLEVGRQLWLVDDEQEHTLAQLDAWNNTEAQLPYAKATEDLRAMCASVTPFEKLSCLRRCLTSISDSVEEYWAGKPNRVECGMDELFPVFVFAIVCAQIPHLCAEANFIADFLDESLMNGEYDLAFVMLQAAVQHLRDDEDGERQDGEPEASK